MLKKASLKANSVNYELDSFSLVLINIPEMRSVFTIRILTRLGLLFNHILNFFSFQLHAPTKSRSKLLEFMLN